MQKTHIGSYIVYSVFEMRESTAGFALNVLFNYERKMCRPLYTEAQLLMLYHYTIIT